mmetsp:Transcript_17912/g.48260  ORF Transcript_17912/g.48260 Transcript_17912/m.48260 type:complete len:311 (-) Transcript_17912:401-1333(-)
MVRRPHEAGHDTFVEGSIPDVVPLERVLDGIPLLEHVDDVIFRVSVHQRRRLHFCKAHGLLQLRLQCRPHVVACVHGPPVHDRPDLQVRTVTGRNGRDRLEELVNTLLFLGVRMMCVAIEAHDERRATSVTASGSPPSVEHCLHDRHCHQAIRVTVKRRKEEALHIFCAHEQGAKQISVSNLCTQRTRSISRFLGLVCGLQFFGKLLLAHQYDRMLIAIHVKDGWLQDVEFLRESTMTTRLFRESARHLLQEKNIFRSVGNDVNRPFHLALHQHLGQTVLESVPINASLVCNIVDCVHEHRVEQCKAHRL